MAERPITITVGWHEEKGETEVWVHITIGGPLSPLTDDVLEYIRRAARNMTFRAPLDPTTTPPREKRVEFRVHLPAGHGLSYGDAGRVDNALHGVLVTQLRLGAWSTVTNYPPAPENLYA